MKKKLKLRLRFKVLLVIIVTSFTFIYTVKWLDTINMNVEDKVLKELLISSSNLNSENKVINKVVRYISNLDLVNPVNLMNVNYKGLIEERVVVIKPSEDEDKAVIGDKNNNPTIYIYNTHQTEKYASTKNELYNIEPDVITASYMLKEKLRILKLNAIVEDNNISEILKSNNWSYASSYKVSRMLLEDAISKNKKLTYYIDLHRDSVNKNITTVNIKDKSYAKILFVLGLEHKNYTQNLKEIEKINNILEKNYPGISRGIYKKSGTGVNGIYNQDFSSKCMLVEVGGHENNLEEVANTIDALANSLKEYIGDGA